MNHSEENNIESHNILLFSVKYIKRRLRKFYKLKNTQHTILFIYFIVCTTNKIQHSSRTNWKLKKPTFIWSNKLQRYWQRKLENTNSFKSNKYITYQKRKTLQTLSWHIRKNNSVKFLKCLIFLNFRLTLSFTFFYFFARNPFEKFPTSVK